MRLPDQVRENLIYPDVRGVAVVLLAAAVMAAATAGYWLTSGSSLQVAQAEAVQLEQRRQQLRGSIELAGLLSEREGELAEFRRRLEEKVDANGIMSGLQKLAESCDVRIVEQMIAGGSPAAGEPFQTRLAIEGGYDHVRCYLAEIPMSAPGLTVIGSLRMKPASTGRLVSSELELLSYSGE